MMMERIEGADDFDVLDWRLRAHRRMQVCVYIFVYICVYICICVCRVRRATQGQNLLYI